MLRDSTRAFSEHEVLFSTGDLPIGTLAGEHIVIERLARGGCGSVYRALHAMLDRVAAVKVLHASLAAQPKMVERFAREVQVVNLLGHPGIVEIYEVGALPDGRPFYAMEYLSGRTLGELLRERGRLPLEEVPAIFEPVCEALAAAHAAGIVHRDIKAGNIMVTGSGVKLLDFGIAKLLVPEGGAGGLTSEGRLIGTPTAMSPEQLRGVPIDARTDVYALGILLFRALTGSLPFDAQSPVALVHQHMLVPAPRPSERAPISPALDAVVLRCLEKQPEHRYDSVQQFVTALLQAVGGAGRRPSSGAYAPAVGVAVYLEIRTRAEAEELDEPMSDDVGAVFDIGEDALRASGYALALATGSRLLAVRLLPASPEQACAGRAAAIDVAASLRRALDERSGAHPRVHVNVCVHAGDVMARRGASLDVIGGALTRVDLWAPGEDVEDLCGTPEAVDGVPDLALAPGPGALVRITRRAPMNDGGDTHTPAQG